MDSIEILVNLSDDDITSICDIIRRPERKSKKENQISVLVAKNL